MVENSVLDLGIKRLVLSVAVGSRSLMHIIWGWMKWLIAIERFDICIVFDLGNSLAYYSLVILYINLLLYPRSYSVYE